MKLTMKHAKTCPCYDPIVFGHDKPCPRWESHCNSNSPSPAGQEYRMMAQQFISMQFAVSGNAQAVQRLHRTMQQFHETMREIDRAAHHG